MLGSAVAVEPVSAAPHPARVADADLLCRVRAACDWWETQTVWRATSSITGGGAVEAFESAIAPHCLALPSATCALRLAMLVHGLSPGDVLGVPEFDWSATLAVAAELGVTTRPLPVNQLGLLDVACLVSRPELLRGLAAVVATDLHGMTVDVPALKRHYPCLIVIEDAARAWSARYPDGSPVGSSADSCALSFGSGKDVAAGELGALVSRTSLQHVRAVGLSQHPARQLYGGAADATDAIVMSRVAPTSALLGAHALALEAADRTRRRAVVAVLARVVRERGLEVMSDELAAAGHLVVRGRPQDLQEVVDRAVIGTVVRCERPAATPHPAVPEPARLEAIANGLVVLRVQCEPMPGRATVPSRC
jgi:dTDP-4-amino-4,6-dideoxygalactose transaminase